jgi:D-alanine-D-alanine ligase
MMKINKRIEIVSSTIAGLSSMGKASRGGVLAVLSKHFVSVRITIVNDQSDLEALGARQPDLVFLGMEFLPVHPALGAADPAKVWLSDFLDEHDIAYTGSSQIAHELERNKPLAKRRILSAGLRTSAFCVVRRGQSLESDDVPLAFPLFIKPTRLGGGLGIDSDSVVHNFEQLRAKVHSITTKLRSDVLIEEYLPGREFSVAILKDDSSNEFLAMPIELVAPSDKNGIRLLSGRVKSSNAEQALEVTDTVIKSKVTALALAVFDALGASDYGRIDIRLDAVGTPHFLEANLIPSLISGYGSFPKACLLNIGLEYEPMIMKIVTLGLARTGNAIEGVLGPITMSGSAFPPSEAVFETI